VWSAFFPQCDERLPDDLVARLWEAGTTGILEESEGFRAWFADDIDPATIAALGGSQIRRETAVQHVEVPDDWAPIPVGNRFLIVPPAYAGATPYSRLLLRLQTGAAFGTGRHETTQLCLEAMERSLQPGAIVLDAGCGSGILSAAAHLLGAGCVVSCDIDPEAVEITRHYSPGLAFLGSADALTDQRFDLVLANLTAPILDSLAWDLKRGLKCGGVLVIAGFLDEHRPASFTPEEQSEHGGWLCWICRPEGITAAPPTLEGLTHKREWWL
jgi:ribosomal protein L11 methylase PrmA